MSLTAGTANNGGELQGLFYGGQSTVDAAPVSSVETGVAGQLVTSTAAQNLIGYTVGAENSVLRLEGYLNLPNAGSVVTLAVAYTDATTKTVETVHFSTTSGQALSTATITNAGMYPLQSMVIFVEKGTAVTVTYTDATATPADAVTVLLSLIGTAS